ncbi:hypothetical protein LZZ90_08075 [Flavobacterium sp. SM15]|uniref:hypothetical protein n=1 Tax=Flavobacterium sp. SM15 TaxID=2908005 RepID=UPI001ED9EF63|nr:hypothetical protein [Flavobacterium sp. SM15]MCG2611462.1 hypothetical protein [Flavobacterium sp. SM15]
MFLKTLHNIKVYIKISVLISALFLILAGCSNDDTNYITVKGKVIREANGEGVPNQKLTLRMKKINGTGYWSYTTEIDSKEVITDSNGNFNVAMNSDSNISVSVSKQNDDDYTGIELTNFNPANDIVLKVNKFMKFKIFVNNTSPFDANDYIYISFFSGNNQSVRTKIENFGIANIFYPQDDLPGGGSFEGHDETAWRGVNVNSIVYYNVPENATDTKIFWTKRKNGIETNGFTSDIPYQIDQINEYHFDY